MNENDETCQDHHARRDGCEIRDDDLDEEIVVPVVAGSPSAIVAWLNRRFN